MKVQLPKQKELSINLGDLFYSKKNDDFYILIVDDVEEYLYLQSLDGVHNLYGDKQITKLAHLENMVFNGEDGLIHYSKSKFALRLIEEDEE